MQNNIYRNELGYFQNEECLLERTNFMNYHTQKVKRKNNYKFWDMDFQG